MRSGKLKKSIFLMTATVGFAGVAFIFVPSRDTTIESTSKTPAIKSLNSLNEENASTGESFNLASTFSLPKQKIISMPYHVFQTFNNCASVAFAITLAYYGVNKTQEEIAEEVRPINNLTGNNDDKWTTPDELVEKAEEYGLVAYTRANGSIELIKRFIAAGFPVMMPTLLHSYEDYGHYRVIKGYDDTNGEFIQDDGYEGKNLRFTYNKWNGIWKPQNYVYIVIGPKEQAAEIEAILGNDKDNLTAWRNSVTKAKAELSKDQNDILARFNLSASLYHIGDYAESVKEYEKVETKLPTRKLWYQWEPIEAYFELGNYNRVFSLTDNILDNKNPSFSEAYILRGKSYLKLGNRELAKKEFEKAVLYNKNLKSAIEALNSVSL